MDEVFRDLSGEESLKYPHMWNVYRILKIARESWNLYDRNVSMQQNCKQWISMQLH